MNDTNDSVRKEQFGNEKDTENTEQNNNAEISPDKSQPKDLNAESDDSDDNESQHSEKEEKSEEPFTSDESTSDEHAAAESVDQPGNESVQEQQPDTPKEPDYSQYNKQELLNEFKKLNARGDIIHLNHQINSIRNLFYKKHNEEIEQAKDEFVRAGNQEADFKPADDAVENEFRQELNKYQQLKADYNNKLDEIKKRNLEEKYKIIEGIKNLINSQESINDTFQEFRELQRKWRETGIVPQQELKNLWESYNYNVEKFYDYIKINKELRDLDFKKNLEAKIKLCEQAEELLLEPNIVTAFRQLQEYHNQWREIGPVPKENRKELWERFREATSTINKKHHEYFENLKKEQKANLEKKTELCEKAEAMADVVYESQKDWEVKSKEIIELQRIWKTIGFAPKKHNTKIYQRFREACDKFFDNKREYYAQNKEEQLDNLQRKTDLCVQAETLKDSTDWKRTTDELIRLQKKWKEIGPVPRKNSEEIWKRFRAACDQFFNRKSDHFSNIDSEYEENLKKKNEIIDKIENFEPGTDVQENINTLKTFQRQWSEIGFVPYKEKDKIQERYRLALNKHFDNLKVNEDRKNLIKYKAKLDNIAAKPRPVLKFRQEREKFFNKLKQLENDITLWENNIGFFSSSDSANEMRKDFENKIKRGKEKIQVLEEKIRQIDDMIDKAED
ncbi:MAG: DUF349 domain-containing protein [Bacteroidetes bacterium]|jgi:hypothetical protein|nr:DUF349 domain-containing protein [Bacteroidota bacterium]